MHNNCEKGLSKSYPLNLVYAYPTDPNVEIMGGMTGYIRFLLRQSLKKGARVKFVGVSFGKREITYESDFDFIPLVRNTDIWWVYLIISFFRVPFLKLTGDEIIHSGRLIFLLPYILFHPKNKKILTSDQPRLAAYLGFPRPAYYVVSALYSPLERFMVKRLKTVISAYHVHEGYWLNRYPEHKSIFKERVYPAVGVNREVFRPYNREEIRESLGIDPHAKVIIYVGRVSQIKGIDLLIEAFDEFHAQEPDSLFLVVGRGEDGQKLQDYARARKAGEYIRFLGEKRGKELVKLYSCADVLVIGSWAEGNSGVLREALSCGIPVVSTDVGDARNIFIDPLLGRVVPNRAPRLFAQAIFEVLSQDKAQVKKACLEKSTQFSEEVCFETIGELYRDFQK